MKRWVSGAMAFIITFSCAQGGMALVDGEVEEIVADAPMEEETQAAFEAEADEIVVTAEPYEADPESDPVEYEDTLGEDDADTEDDEDDEGDDDIPDEDAGTEAVRYARIAAETAAVLAAPDGAALATLSAGSAVLVLEQAEAWSSVAFDTERGVVTGWIAAEGLAPLDADETAAFLDALAQHESVALYDGDIDRPLERLDCAFAEPEAEEIIEEDPAEPEAGAAEDVEDIEEPAEADVTAEEAANAPQAAETADAQDGAAEAVEAPAVNAEAQAEQVPQTEAVPQVPQASQAATTPTASDETGAVVQQAEDTSAKVAEAALQLNVSQCTLGLKESYALTAAGGSGSVTWASSNAKIVKVDAATGIVKGLKKGSATITATSGDGQTASVKVTVKGAPKKIAFNPKKITIGGADRTVALKLKFNKGAASAGTVYASSNEAVATVDQSGVVTSHGTGTAVITAVTYNKKKATCKVTVYTDPLPAAVALPAKVSIGIKETRAQLPIQFTPAAGDSSCSTAVTWSSSNKKIVKVNPTTGAIKGLKKGSATIVAKTPNGLKAKCRVTVKKAPKKVTLKPASSSIDIGGTVQFGTTLPKGTASGFTFTSSNTAVATVDANGLATGVGAGSATITVATYNGKKASATIQVKDPTPAATATDTGTTTSTDTSTKSEVSIPSAIEKLGVASYQDAYSAGMTNQQKLEYVIYCAQSQLGKPYKYGGGYSNDDDPSGFDCSGLVYWSFRRAGIKLKDTANSQGNDRSYTKVVGIDSLVRGDVVCFNTDSESGSSVNHTGIYLGSGYFIHASSGSSKRKVIVQKFSGDSISSDFYKRHFLWGRRILE